MKNKLNEAISNHRKYVSMGLDIKQALVSVTEQLKQLHAMREARTFSNEFRSAMQAEIERLNIESSAMHVIFKEIEANLES